LTIVVFLFFNIESISSLRTRRNSHKLDVDDDVEIGKDMSEGKRTRRNSHKLDVDDDVVKDNDEIDSILKDKKTKIVKKKP
jgi:hypothetical protein